VTQFTQKINYQRALQGELARTIAALKPVHSARVHLVLPEKRLLKSQQEPAKASVVVDLVQGQSLNSGQIQGIVHLVSGSIQGLGKNQVTIVDGAGNILNNNSGGLMDGNLGPERLKYIHLLETRLEDRAQSLLDTALGPGNSLVRVTAQLDFSQKVSTQELYDPDVLIPRSEKTTEKSSGESRTGGIPGAESNLRTGTDSTSGTSSSSSSEIVNYEINKTVNQLHKSVGDIERLSVAVLIKDTFVPGGQGKQGSYEARSPEELRSFQTMVSSALGLKSSRGDTIEVVSLPFNNTQAEGTEVTSATGYYRFLPYLKYVLIGLGIILLYLFLIRPLLRTLQAETVQYPMTVRELEEGYDGGDTQSGVELDPAAKLKRQIEKEIIEKRTSPAQVIRVWLKEG
jgi:flagellar M-ring protein FliF